MKRRQLLIGGAAAVAGGAGFEYLRMGSMADYDAATELPIWVPEVDSEEAATTYVRPLFEGFRTTFATRRTARV